MYVGLLDTTEPSVYVYGKDTDISEYITYLGSVVHNDSGSSLKVMQWISLAHGAMDSLNMSIWCCQYLWGQMKIRIFKSLVISVLL